MKILTIISGVVLALGLVAMALMLAERLLGQVQRVQGWMRPESPQSPRYTPPTEAPTDKAAGDWENDSGAV